VPIFCSPRAPLTTPARVNVPPSATTIGSAAGAGSVGGIWISTARGWLPLLTTRPPGPRARPLPGPSEGPPSGRTRGDNVGADGRSGGEVVRPGSAGGRPGEDQVVAGSRGHAADPVAGVAPAGALPAAAPNHGVRLAEHGEQGDRGRVLGEPEVLVPDSGRD